MKYFFFILFVTILSCGKNPEAPKKVAKSDTTNWEALYALSSSTWLGIAGPLKRVISTTLGYKEDTAKDGTITRSKQWIIDTVYLVATLDTTMPIKNVAKQDSINPVTHKIEYYSSYAHPLILPSDVVFPLFPIPSRFPFP